MFNDEQNKCNTLRSLNLYLLFKVMYCSTVTGSNKQLLLGVDPEKYTRTSLSLSTKRLSGCKIPI